MRRSALALVVAALAMAPFAGSANAGCVTDLFTSSAPGLGGTVRQNPDGSVTVDPNPAQDFAGAMAGQANAFVVCMV